MKPDLTMRKGNLARPRCRVSVIQQARKTWLLRRQRDSQRQAL